VPPQWGAVLIGYCFDPFTFRHHQIGFPEHSKLHMDESITTCREGGHGPAGLVAASLYALAFRQKRRSSHCDRQQKTGTKAGFLFLDPKITGRREQQAQSERLPSERLQQEQLPSERLQQERLPSERLRQEQQLPEPEPQQQALQQEQALLLFDRKQSWKQPAEQPGGRNISFDFPLHTVIKPTPEIGPGLDIQPTRGF
jgi:hypothetical protein